MENNSLHEIESKLFRFKMLLPCVPFPFEVETVAFNEKSAIQKGIAKVGQYLGENGKPLKAWGPPIHIEKSKYLPGAEK